MRCSWCNDNPIYLKYHDEEWCNITKTDDRYLFEMFILEMFQAGLSFECIINKRENFRQAFDNFDYIKISNYDSKKIEELINNKDIIRNKRKIESTINNAKIYIEIINKYDNFYEYLCTFSKNKVYLNSKEANTLSENLTKDLKSRGMKFIGKTIIYSYLESIGIINSHEKQCFLYKKVL